MKIFRTAGSYESNDCLVTVTKADGLTIEIESVVFEEFGDQIYAVALETLKQLKATNMHVHIKDKGALDYTIRARIKTAVQRLGDNRA